VRTLRSCLVAAAATCAWPIGVDAQAKTQLQLVPLVSIQPVGYENALPYLDNGLGGTQPGFSLGLQRLTASGFLYGVELSTSQELHAMQSGRFVLPASGGPCGRVPSDGCGPVEARHRDTLLTALVGKRFDFIEPKVGFSLIFGQPKQGQADAGDAGQIALTAGADGAWPISSSADIVVSVRYSYAFRGDEAMHVGLGNHIVRVGVGVRLSLR
jgi:hypothetical protein